MKVGCFQNGHPETRSILQTFNLIKELSEKKKNYKYIYIKKKRIDAKNNY